MKEGQNLNESSEKREGERTTSRHAVAKVEIGIHVVSRDVDDRVGQVRAPSTAVPLQS